MQNFPSSFAIFELEQSHDLYRSRFTHWRKVTKRHSSWKRAVQHWLVTTYDSLKADGDGFWSR